MGRLSQSFKKKNLKYFLTNHQPNRAYLSGFTGSNGWVLVGENDQYILTDSRYFEQAQKQAPYFKIVEINKPLEQFWPSFESKLDGKVGFESHVLTHQTLEKLKSCSKTLSFVPTVNLVENLRSFKDSVEISLIKKSAEIADKAFISLLKLLKLGQTEKEVAWLLEKIMRDLGAERVAWHPLVVASGPNSSMAHHEPDNKIIKYKEILLLDFGAVVGNYHSDMTRVVFMGKPRAEQARVYQAVLEAQEKAKEKIKHHAQSQKIDQAAREQIQNYGLPVYQHGLSHGIGLEVHELPRVSINSTDILNEGNVISVEPGVYIPGWGGIRIEDLVLVTKSGYEDLTKSPKNIQDVTVKVL